ncbi:MAG: adenylate cyclase [Puniceicoccaceae bacterium 5H]|nr:MAG: adenylate cyclase [Puniceicoccaceae bacterium 5H]
MSELRKSLRKRVHYLWLLLVPLVWIFLSEQGWLSAFKHLSMDLRFNVRGPVTTQEKVTYVNADEATAEAFGTVYFPRQIYADAARAVLEEGGAKAVFLDFVLSRYNFSAALNKDLLLQGDYAMSQVVNDYPDRVVLAASYAGTQNRELQKDMYLPRLADGPYGPDHPQGYSPRQNPIPELPQYPIWIPDLQSHSGHPVPHGRAGLVNTDVVLNDGAVPRFVPLYVEVANEGVSASYLEGFILWMRDAGAADDTLKIYDSEDGTELLAKDDSGAIYDQVPKVVDTTFYAASLALYRAAYPDTEVEIHEHEIRLRRPDDAGQLRTVCRIPLMARQSMEINWLSPWIDPEVRAGQRDPLDDRYNPQCSLVEVYDRYQALQDSETSAAAKKEIRQWFQHFNDSVVLIGPTDVLLQDLAPTPFDAAPVPKVSVHGNAFKTIAGNRFIHRLPDWAEWLITFLLTFCVTGLTVWGGSQTRFNKVGALLILVMFVGLDLELFRRYSVVVPLVVPLGAALSTSLIGAVMQLIREEQQKGRIRNMFGSYVSPQVVERMVDSDEAPQLGGHTEEITAFFSDIQSFSSFSEVLPPGELVVLMNEYLNAMTEILEEEEGTLDKYIGDAIVAMFGAPVQVEHHAYLACRAALRIQQRQAELRDEWRALGDRWPSLVHQMQTRIGLNTGPAVVGNMGSRKRFNYTMMGDTVNLAARNESGAKTYGVYTMVSDETRQRALEVSPEFTFRYLDKIVVKGRSQPVAVYELLGERGQLPASVLECLTLYGQAMELYLEQQWDAAQALFQQAAQLEPHAQKGETNPSLVMAQRCDQWRAQPPPADWDGRFIMRTK